MVSDGVDDDAIGGARLLALDWGSTHLRAWLLGAGGAVLAERDADQGASAMDGDAHAYSAVLERIAGDWLSARPDLPIVACGMVGSQHGWREAPYAACPAGAADLAGALVRVESGGRTVAIVPGASCRDAGDDVAGDRSGDRGGVPDVMRGEETQIVGALALQPDLAPGATLVLPGTHSKWARIADGRILHFATYMTGELYALLRAHSVLGRLMTDDEAPLEDGFDAGVRAAAGNGGLTHQLFAVRTLGLMGEVAPAALSGYLSGLLIGSEIDSALHARDGEAPDVAPSVALVGAPALTALYERALRLRGVMSVRRLDNTAPAGLWRLAAAAGLITDSEVTP
jgi:2-dehydro-3-deoxygalactonokinase